VAPPVTPTQAITAMIIPTTAAAVRVAATIVTVLIVAQAWYSDLQFPSVALQETKLQSAPDALLEQDLAAKPQPWKSKHLGIAHLSLGLAAQTTSVDAQPVGLVVLSADLLQVQILQGLVSLQNESSGVIVQAPVVLSQVSVVQLRPSSQWEAASKLQVPATQESLVHKLLSSQTICECWHPLVSLHVSIVQGSLSSQSKGLKTHPPPVSEQMEFSQAVRGVQTLDV